MFRIKIIQLVMLGVIFYPCSLLFDEKDAWLLELFIALIIIKIISNKIYKYIGKGARYTYSSSKGNINVFDDRLTIDYFKVYKFESISFICAQQGFWDSQEIFIRLYGGEIMTLTASSKNAQIASRSVEFINKQIKLLDVKYVVDFETKNYFLELHDTFLGITPRVKGKFLYKNILRMPLDTIKSIDLEESWGTDGYLTIVGALENDKGLEQAETIKAFFEQEANSDAGLFKLYLTTRLNKITGVIPAIPAPTNALSGCA